MEKQKNILIIICGGIAAYKCLDIIRRLKNCNHTVSVVMTKSAKKFITPLSISTLCHEKVYIDQFDLTSHADIAHIEQASKADLIAVIPATANFISKYSNAIADNLALTILLACKAPVFIFPAMNPNMYENKLLQNNIAKLNKLENITVFKPDFGEMACGHIGKGRLLKRKKIINIINDKLKQSDTLRGFSALITAGATIEAIDPVRYITNRSSGKQGYAIADALAKLGAKVTLISGSSQLDPPANVNLLKITSAKEMLACITKQLPADIVVCCAAISDYYQADISTSKIKKEKHENLTLNLKPTPDIATFIANYKPKVFVGFAAETNNLVQNAIEKINKKQFDFILANKVGKNLGFDKDDNKIVFITRYKDGHLTKQKWKKMLKTTIATKLANIISKKINKEYKND